MCYAIFLLIFPIILVAGTVPRPIVLWHGMGDSYASPGVTEFIHQVQRVHPDIFVHSIFLNEDLDKDRQAGFVSSSTICKDFLLMILLLVWECQRADRVCCRSAGCHSRVERWFRWNRFLSR